MINTEDSNLLYLRLTLTSKASNFFMMTWSNHSHLKMPHFNYNRWNSTSIISWKVPKNMFHITYYFNSILFVHQSLMSRKLFRHQLFVNLHFYNNSSYKLVIHRKITYIFLCIFHHNRPQFTTEICRKILLLCTCFLVVSFLSFARFHFLKVVSIN